MRTVVSVSVSLLLVLACGAALAQEVTEEGQPVLVPPTLREYVQADYPQQAFADGLEAEVVARLDIDENGLVTGVEITEPAGNGFDEAATDAMFAFVFDPATSDGEAIPSQVIYRYTFFIKEEAPPPEDLPDPVATLTGAITDMDGEPVVGASVLAVFLGTEDDRDQPDPSGDAGPDEDFPDLDPVVTDEEGLFRLADLTPGSYQIDVVASGFKPFTSTEDLDDNEERDLIYRLDTESAMYETVVQGRRPPREVTRREITRREITRIPGTGGDALRSIQNLPGMARASMGGGDLIVRGSSPEDSGYYFDQIPVPMLYHFGGLTSVVNSDLLERIDFYPGNYGVRYGGATGGIVDVTPRSPATDGFHASLDADFWDISVLAESPIGEDWSVAASVRRSYIDWILNAVLPKDGGFQMTVAPRYYDYQLVVDYHPGETRSDKCTEQAARELGKLGGSSGDSMVSGGAYIALPEECKKIPGKDHLRLFVYGSDDKMVFLFGDDVSANPNFGGGLNMGIFFHQAQLRWDHAFNGDVRNEINLSSGYWGMKSKFGEDFKFDQGQVPIFLRDEISIDANRFFTFRTGLDTAFFWAKWKVRAPMQNPGEGETFDPVSSNDTFMETSGKGWFYRPSWYGEVEMTPVERLRLMYGLRVDYYSMLKKAGVDPRFVARWEVIDGTTVKGGLGLFHQAPNSSEWDDEYGNPDLDLIGAVHYSLGVEQRLFANIEVGLEGFYKDIYRLVATSNDTVMRDGEEVAERYNNAGRGKVYGMEFLLKQHPTDRFFGWISYTLMRSSRVDHPGEEERLFDYDQTHILTIVASAVLGRGWEAGVRFRLVSGNPSTPILGSTYDADGDIYWPLYGSTNSDRLPMFHQLDVRIDKKWRIRNTIDFAVYIDVQNIYNHSNVEGYMYSYDYSQKVYFTGLPILPSLGIKIAY